MRFRNILFLVIPMTVLITVMLYKPVSVAIFRLTEPYFRYPINGPMEIRNDAMGEGNYGTKRSGHRTHSGIDILAPVGTEVYASKSGIAFFGNVPRGYGKYVSIYHPDGYQTFYGHLSDWSGKGVKEVRRGEVIGYVGKTGNAASKLIKPHLHFEIRRDGEALDPAGLLR